jgi:hypothetical protein
MRGCLSPPGGIVAWMSNRASSINRVGGMVHAMMNMLDFSTTLRGSIDPAD